jgi:hypothetical protein
MARWSQYQEDVAVFFGQLGLEAATNVSVTGARTTHDIDVVVRGNLLGVDLLWIVECKLWATRVSKLHVLALREIVHDVGADRGLIVAERWFQRGAFEAAQLTNVILTSMEDLRANASRDVAKIRLQELCDRIAVCLDRYWTIDKEPRIDLGLRPDVGQHGYSTIRILEGAMAALDQAFRDKWPAQPPFLHSMVDSKLDFSADTPEDLLTKLEPLIVEVEQRLADAVLLANALVDLNRQAKGWLLQCTRKYSSSSRYSTRRSSSQTSSSGSSWLSVVRSRASVMTQEYRSSWTKIETSSLPATTTSCFQVARFDTGG